MIFMLAKNEDETNDASTLGIEIIERLPARLRPSIEISIGDKDFLIGVLSDKDLVVVLLGAECYDSSGRVVHARGAKQEVEQMRNECKRNGIQMKVVVVAEEYKKIDRKNGTLLGNKKLFRTNLSGLDVYNRGTVQCIISDAEVRLFDEPDIIPFQPELTYGGAVVEGEPTVAEVSPDVSEA